MEAIQRSLVWVFEPNWRDLLSILAAPVTDVTAAFELVQNVRAPTKRDLFEASLTRSLHNYLASSMSLTDHAKVELGTCHEEISTEFGRRGKELSELPVVKFMRFLRNFTMHEMQPWFGHTLSMERIRADSPEMSAAYRTTLSTAELLGSRMICGRARSFVAESGSEIVLNEVIALHGQLISGFCDDLVGALRDAASVAQHGLHGLMVEANMVRFNVDYEKAVEITDARALGDLWRE